MNGIAAYSLAIELGKILPGCRVVKSLLLPAGFRLIFDRGDPPGFDLLFFSREAEIVPSSMLEIPAGHTREIFGALRGAVVAGAAAPGPDRVIVIDLRQEDSWAKSCGYSLRLDLSPGMKAVSLFQMPEGKACGAHGVPGSRMPRGPFETADPGRWSILDLPEDCPGAISELLARASEARGTGQAEGMAAREAAPALVSMIGGLDPALSRYLAGEFGSSPETLWLHLAALGRALASQRFEWNVYDLPGTGREGECALYPVGLPAPARFAKSPGMLEALRVSAAGRVLPQYVSHLRKAAAAPLKKEIRRARKLLGKLSEDLGEAGRAVEFRRYADLLATNRHLLKRGMREITLKDFTGGASLTIPLDPSLDPDRNIRKYFRKAKKGARGLPVIGSRIEKVKSELEKKVLVLGRLESLDSPADLLRHAPPMRELSLKRDDAEKTTRFKRFRLDDKHCIYAGRSGAENDELTHEFASPSDLWFHAQGSAGSHVILKGADRSTSRRMIETAAAVAAWFSKSRNSRTVPVIYTEKRHVRKPRGSRPGTAACQREKTIFVTPALPDETGPADDDEVGGQ